MLVVGLFAVLSWDSTYPDRRDVFILGPLPVRGRTLFVAKIAALATALGVTVAALNAVSGLAWPHNFVPLGEGLLGQIRSFGAYWITILAAGAFIFTCVLAVQGLAGQFLPRRPFLRVSAVLQMAAFCLFLSVYFLQPSLTTPRALLAAENQRALAWLPSYWFLGLFQTLNGSPHAAMIPLARRAILGFAIAFAGTATAFVLSYFRTLRKIVEEPDIVPSSGGLHWSPRFGNPLATAVVQFSARTLFRSRQHRVVLAFYLGIGFTAVIFLLFVLTSRHLDRVTHQVVLGPAPGAPALVSNVLVATLVMMCAAVFGTRVVFSVPLSLRANWVFRVTQVRSTREYLRAIRRPLFLLAVLPIWAGSAAVCLWILPWRTALVHLAVLALWGIILAYLCLYEFHKIPFTCSYLPGKSRVNLVVLGAVALFNLLLLGVEFERRALDDPRRYAPMLAVLAVAAFAARWRTVGWGSSEEDELQFEQEETPAITGLGIDRDGALADFGRAGR
jgi:hypothetical protein